MMGIFRAILDFILGLGCFIIGLILVVIIVGIGALIWFFGPFILAGVVGLLFLIGLGSAIFRR